MNNDNISIGEWRKAWEDEHAENERLRERIADLERSAASAREIARVAMSHTNNRTIRFEVVCTSAGMSLVVCDPIGNEEQTMRRVADLLGVSLCTALGLDLAKHRSIPIGSDR